MNSIINPPNRLANVIRLEGAPQYYIRLDQIYRQNVDAEGELIEGDEEHINWGKTPEGAMAQANGLQLAANKKYFQESLKKQGRKKK